jgi:hypothetical protein
VVTVATSSSRTGWRTPAGIKASAPPTGEGRPLPRRRSSRHGRLGRTQRLGGSPSRSGHGLRRSAAAGAAADATAVAGPPR